MIPESLHHLHRSPGETEFLRGSVPTPPGPTVRWLAGPDASGGLVLVFDSPDPRVEEDEYVLRSRWRGGEWSEPSPFLRDHVAGGIFPVEASAGLWGLGWIAAPFLADAPDDLPAGVLPPHEVWIQHPLGGAR